MSEKEPLPPPAKTEWVKSVVHDLLLKEKRTSAWEILDLYFARAETMADYDNLGWCAIKAEYREMYLKCALAAYFKCTDTEQLFNARSNLYKVYNAINRPEQALFYIEQNLKMIKEDSDEYSDLMMQKAGNISLMGNKVEAEKIIDEVLASNKAYDEENQKYMLSGRLLREGKTTEGILAFIDTFKPNHGLLDKQFHMEKWSGGERPGRTIYVSGEGGIGDEFINIRFMNNLKDLGMKPVLYSSWSMYRPDTVDIFRRHGHEVIMSPYSIKRNELWTHMMSLPGYLGVTEKDLWTGPYLTPKRDPKNNLPKTDKFRIGIKCNGNPYFSQDVYRSIPIEKMLEYLPKDVEIYYFDKDKTHPECINMNDKLNSWDDTMDYIDQMDVIVSSCTSIVHAAGAMGKPVIVMVPIAEYYIWTSTRTDETSPWYDYPEFKVLKQSEVRDWNKPLARMKELVEKMRHD